MTLTLVFVLIVLLVIGLHTYLVDKRVAIVETQIAALLLSDGVRAVEIHYAIRKMKNGCQCQTKNNASPKPSNLCDLPSKDECRWED